MIKVTKLEEVKTMTILAKSSIRILFLGLFILSLSGGGGMPDEIRPGDGNGAIAVTINVPVGADWTIANLTVSMNQQYTLSVNGNINLCGAGISESLLPLYVTTCNDGSVDALSGGDVDVSCATKAGNKLYLGFPVKVGDKLIFSADTTNVTINTCPPPPSVSLDSDNTLKNSSGAGISALTLCTTGAQANLTDIGLKKVGPFLGQSYDLSTGNTFIAPHNLMTLKRSGKSSILKGSALLDLREEPDNIGDFSCSTSNPLGNFSKFTTLALIQKCGWQCTTSNGGDCINAVYGDATKDNNFIVAKDSDGYSQIYLHNVFVGKTVTKTGTGGILTLNFKDYGFPAMNYCTTTNKEIISNVYACNYLSYHTILNSDRFAIKFDQTSWYFDTPEDQANMKCFLYSSCNVGQTKYTRDQFAEDLDIVLQMLSPMTSSQKINRESSVFFADVNEQLYGKSIDDIKKFLALLDAEVADARQAMTTTKQESVVNGSLQLKKPIEIPKDLDGDLYAQIIGASPGGAGGYNLRVKKWCVPSGTAPGLYMYIGNKITASPGPQPGDPGVFSIDAGISESGEYIINGFNGNVPTDGNVYFKIITDSNDTTGSYQIDYAKPGYTDLVSKTAGALVEPLTLLYRGTYDDATGQYSGGVMQSMYDNISTSSLRNSVTILLALYIWAYSVGLMIGTIEEPVAEAMKRILKMMLIIQLFSGNSWRFFYNIFFTFFWEGTAFLTNLFSSAVDTQLFQGSRIGADFAFLDSTIGVLISVETLWKIVSLLFAGPMGWIFFLIVIAGFYGILLGVAKGVILYMTYIVFTSFLIGTAPIFACFSLFGFTDQIFQSWLRRLIATSMQVVVYFTFFGFINQVMFEIIHRIFNYGVYKECVIPIAISGIDPLCLLYLPIPYGAGDVDFDSRIAEAVQDPNAGMNGSFGVPISVNYALIFYILSRLVLHLSAIAEAAAQSIFSLTPFTTGGTVATAAFAGLQYAMGRDEKSVGERKKMMERKQPVRSIDLRLNPETQASPRDMTAQRETSNEYKILPNEKRAAIQPNGYIGSTFTTPEERDSLSGQVNSARKALKDIKLEGNDSVIAFVGKDMRPDIRVLKGGGEFNVAPNSDSNIQMTVMQNSSGIEMKRGDDGVVRGRLSPGDVVFVHDAKKYGVDGASGNKNSDDSEA